MDNIRQILCEKIESLINGGDRRCLTLSERYHRHLIKHHSLRSNLAPDTTSIHSSRRIVPLPSSSKANTATTVGDMEEKNINVESSIKKEIIDWSSDLPVYYNPKFEELKENVVNDLIETIGNLLKGEGFKENLLDKVEKEISQNIYCIPLTYEQHKHFEAKLLRNIKDMMKGNSNKRNLKSIENLILYEDKHLKESENNKYLLQNSYIDMIKNISPALLSDFQLTSIEINSKLSLRTDKRIVYTNFEILNYTSTFAKYGNIIENTAFNIRNKLNVSSDSIIGISNIREIQPNTRRYILRDFCNSILIYRSEDQKRINIYPTTSQNKRNQELVCDVDTIKNELHNWLLEKDLLLQYKTKLNKNNCAIVKTAKTLHDHIMMSKKVSYSILSKDVDKLIKRFIKPTFKNDTNILSKELIHKLYSLCPKIESISEKVLANRKTQASICKNIENDTLECSFKKLLLKYVAVLNEEESLTVKEAYRVLFKNKIQSMLSSKLCSKHSVIKDQEELLSYELKNDLENIKFIIDWVKTTESEKTISNLETKSKVLIDIVKILRSKKDSVTDTTLISQKILYKLSNFLESDSKNYAITLANELLQRHPKQSLCKECYNQNRSDVVDDYFYLHGKEIIKENWHFNAFTKLILLEIPNHCLCHLCSILLHNDFEYMKEICKWLDSLPFLSANDRTNNKEIMNMVVDFINEIKFNVEQQDDDHDFIKNFVVALPLSRNSKFDIQSATLELKKRLQYVDDIYNESKRADSLEEHSSKIDIVTEITNWCQSLPFTISDKTTTVTLKKALALNLLKKIGELNVSSEYNKSNNEALYEKDVSVEIDKILNNFPLSYTSDSTKQSLQDQVLKKLIYYFEVIKKKSTLERYILHLSNLIELSLRSNANITTEEDEILFEKITNGLIYLSLLRQFETNDIELQKKYFLFVVEEIFVYISLLQFANTLLMVPFMLGPIEDYTFNLVECRNHPFIVKIMKLIKTKYVLCNWIDTLPIQKPNDLQEMIQTYDMLTVLTNSVLVIENEYNYNDSRIDAALKKCIKILPLPNSLLERFYFDMKNILTTTLNERNSVKNKTKEHHDSKTNQKYSQPHLIPHQAKNTVGSTRSEASQSSSNIKETRQWYSLPPDTTVDDQSTRSYNNTDGKYNYEQNSRKSSQHELSSIQNEEFQKKADFISPAMGSSSITRINHDLPQTTYRNEPSTANYEDFEKGVDFKSSMTESSPLRQNTKIVDPIKINKNALTEKQVDTPEAASQMSLPQSSSQLKFKNESMILNYDDFENGVNLKSSLTEPSQTQRSKASQIIDIKEIISQESKNDLRKEQISSGSHKSHSPMKLELNGKSQKSSQTSSLDLLKYFNERSESSDRPYDTACKCHKKYLPSYLRRYCKMCNSFPLSYLDFHFC